MAQTRSIFSTEFTGIFALQESGVQKVFSFLEILDIPGAYFQNNKFYQIKDFRKGNAA